MAALRRLISTFTNFTYSGKYAVGKQPRATKTLRLIAAGVCIATGAGAAAHYYSATHEFRIGQIGGRWILALPSVSAKDKAKAFDHLDDEDVYMSSHKNRFRMFSSVEYEGQLYMTPLNFIQSVTMTEPKKKRIWKTLTKQELEEMLGDTPPVCKGSSNLFRNLRERGIIGYTEYLFLLCILTKPHAGFKIAFNMFDADGNQMVDKGEFLVLEDIFRKKEDKKDGGDDPRLPDKLVPRQDSQELEPRGMWDVLRRSTSQVLFSDLSEHIGEHGTDTTLLVHFFGKKGNIELNFDDFYSFMDNLQTEVLEIEFLSYSRGLPTISEEDFARILLRFTDLDNISAHLENLRQSIPDEKGITFEEFRTFFQFLNNLEDFAIAMQMYNFANRSIGQDEFSRAVYVATGLKLSHHLVNTVFKIFDEDQDDKLSYKEFIGVMKDRRQRSARGFKGDEKFTSFKSCLKKELSRK